MIQEHNVKEEKKIEYLAESYHIILNKSILLKGGTLTTSGLYDLDFHFFVATMLGPGLIGAKRHI